MNPDGLLKGEDRSVTFIDNMKLPVHRWFRYSAGFSAEWVASEITKFERETNTIAKILDPFLGSGTTSFVGFSTGTTTYGYEGHPYIARIAKAKNNWHLDISDFKNACREVHDTASRMRSKSKRYDKARLLGKCYDSETLNNLDRLRTAYESLYTEDPIWELVWLNITSILRICSNVCTAQSQYILPNKPKKAKVYKPREAFMDKMSAMAEDMEIAQKANWSRTAHIYNRDVRKRINAPKCNMLISSPPYPNNFDYADATRLEMTFWGEIESWADLKKVVRPTLIRSCSQHAASDKINVDDMLEDPLLDSIKDQITPIIKKLDRIRHGKGGHKTYHSMVAAYFYDLSKIIRNCRRVMDSGSKICFVIGCSAPYGVHVPAERVLGELCLSHGFKSFTFEKVRDRNTKWKNRTHTVPLTEGRLWIEG